MNLTDRKPSSRVTLTKTNRASKVGADLLKLLTEITADGRISDAEIASLRGWLASARSESSAIPAVAALRDVVEEALVDGTVTNDERKEIVGIVLRVLPAEERKSAESNIKSAASKTARIYQMKPGPTSRPPKIRTAELEPATGPQLDYLRALNVTVDESRITKWEASAAIDSALNSATGVSNRQMMVLRFWSRVDIANRGKRGVSEWMDEWYSEDPDRIAAWELWKEAHGDCGRQTDPAVVPLGAGFDWIKKVSGRTLHPLLLGKILVAVFMISVVAFAIYSCTRSTTPVGD